MSAQHLPPSVRVFERGWLSANNILLDDGKQATLIDSGYCTHADQTRALVTHALKGRALDVLINTHLHSDHCGGNAALQAAYPGLQTFIPPGHATYVRDWNADALSYTPTGQSCPQFGFADTLQPGNTFHAGGLDWQIHAAPGHDPHSLIFFEPQSRTLISADALWQHGFGVIFPALDGPRAFDETAATLDLIERLNPATVIPGHGSVFTDVTDALARARSRLNHFAAHPKKHASHGIKVLIKYHLLEVQSEPLSALQNWCANTPYFSIVHQAWFADMPREVWFEQMLQSLMASKAAELIDGRVVNRD
jgi:glyoxylase-like metal-dependent hydrolase (beta-lactamase superfamily II)